MSKIALYSTIAGAGTVGAVVVAVVTGLIEWPANTPDAPVAVVQNAAKPVTQVPDTVATAEPTSDTDETSEPAAVPVQAPKFDLVRAETDGSTLVAGVAMPGAEVEVLVDGEAVAMAPVGGDGKFVAFVDLPTEGNASVITLRTTQDERQIVSVEEVIVAPVANEPAAPKPDVVAALDVPESVDVPEDTIPPQVDVADEIPAKSDAPDVVETTTDAPVQVDATDPEPEPGMPAASEGTGIAQADAAPVVASETDTTAVASLTAPAALPQPEVGAGEGPSASSEAPSVGEVDVAAVTPEISLGQDTTVVQSDPIDVENPSPEAAPTQDVAVVQSAPSADVTTDVLTPAAAAGVAPSTDTRVDGENPVVSARNEPDVTPEPAQPRAPAVLISSPDGVEVLQASPLSQGEVALDSISYDAEGEVLLSGRGEEAAYVRVYLDNTPVTTSQITEDGKWRIELPEVDTGTYTLRVDQVNEAGAVTARVESPFLRESPAVLEAARGDGQGPIRSITVQPGNTLWGISRSRYGRGMAYVNVFEANKDRIRDPDLIYPGQIFDLPTEVAASE